MTAARKGTVRASRAQAKPAPPRRRVTQASTLDAGIRKNATDKASTDGGVDMGTMTTNAIKSLKSTMDGAFDSIQSSTRHAASATMGQVKERPGTAVAVAMVAGALIGALVRRR